MPKRRVLFANNELYHITVRRIGKQLLFQDIDDYYRGIFSIYEFNTSKLVQIRDCRDARREESYWGRTPVASKREEDRLVEVLAFCFMPNHIHLLLRQIKDNGISRFMQKFGSGYACYFKEKYKQKGTGYFFQGRFIAVHIEDDDQLKIVFAYIHTNPVALVEPNWKEKGISYPNEAVEFLQSYKWSSYQDYIEKKNFPSVTVRSFLLDVIGGSEKCKEFIDNWVKYKADIKKATGVRPQ